MPLVNHAALLGGHRLNRTLGQILSLLGIYRNPKGMEMGLNLMKLFLVMLLLALVFPASALARSSGGGHYKSGKGSSHKGGSYKNKATHDHYRKH